MFGWFRADAALALAVGTTSGAKTFTLTNNQTVTLSSVDDVWPEERFQATIVSLLNELLKPSGQRFILLEGFGLDIALFLATEAQPIVRFIEVKAFGAQRAGGVGFGDRHGAGPQVDLLVSPIECLPILSSTVRWVYVDATQPAGTSRYGLFTCETAKAAAMGRVARGKQNNLRVSALREHLIGWNELCTKTQQFVLPTRNATAAA